MSKLDTTFERTSQQDPFISVKEIGGCFEALAIAYECVEFGKGKSLDERLKGLGISKDFYYARFKSFREKTGIDLIEVVDAHLHDKADDRDKDILRKYEFIRGWLHDESKDRDAMRVRIGVSPILCRKVVPQVLREFREMELEKKAKKELSQTTRIYLDIDLSGRLQQKLRDGRIDLYVSQVPTEEKVEDDRKSNDPNAFNYALVCNPGHPIADAVRKQKNSDPVALSELKNTTLALIGPHADRSPQIIFPRWEIQKEARQVRIVEVPEFGHAHDMVACGGNDIATLTIPELLDEDLLMEVELIPVSRIKGLEGIEPLRLGVKRNSSMKSDGAYDPVSELAVRFETVLRDMRLPAKSSLEQLFDSKQFRHIYFVRTKGKDESGNVHSGWAHSAMRWQLLRGQCVKGTHTVDAQRNPKGGYDVPEPRHQELSVLGWLVEPPKEKDASREMDARKKWYHLVWHGVSQDKAREAYVASFVFQEQDLGKDLVGVYAGRRTTASDKPYEPAAGFMVISNTPLDENSAKARRELLTTLNNLVNEYLEYNPGLQQAPPPRWEWQTPRRGDEPSLEGVSPLESFAHSFEDCVRRIGELQALQEQLYAHIRSREKGADNP